MRYYFVLILLLAAIYALYIVEYNKETFCGIEYQVCDNYCQRAKLDLCASYEL